MSETIAALERLAAKHGATLGNLARADLQVALALASLCLPVDATCTEPEVNVALKGWLAGAGAMLRIDHVELRRTLIDFGLWQRDGYGRAYRRAPSIGDAELARHVEALRAIDAGAIVAAVRERRAADHARRKALNDATRSGGS